MDKVKKRFEDTWDNGKFDSKVMCDDGQYRVLNDPGKIWKFIEKELKTAGEVTGETSDGYHTFGELYEHRIVLFINLCLMFHVEHLGHSDVWRSKLHSDGSSIDGWFIMGIYREKGKQITYHLPMRKWEETAFVPTLERAPEWDGHTASDVLERLVKKYE